MGQFYHDEGCEKRNYLPMGAYSPARRLKPMEWFKNSRLFDLARQGQRLTNIFALIPLSFIIIILSQLAVIPVFLGIIAIYGRDHISSEGTLIGFPALVSGFWESLLLTASFGLIYVFTGLWLHFFEKRPFWTLGYELKNAAMQYGRGILIGMLMLGGAVGLLTATGNIALEKGDPAQQGLAALGGVIIMLIGWVVQGGAEEVIFRGWMLPTLGARYRPWVGLLVSSLLFALLHGRNPGLSAFALVNLALFGVFAGLYAMREGSIWGISALHSVWNWVQGNFFGFEVSGTNASGGTLLNLMETGQDWLTGGTFGPEGGLAVTIVLLIGILVTLFWKRTEPAQEIIS
jgi:membrane protease YdiL (CAAX protease family)